MKKCEECNKEFDTQFRNTQSKYCGEECRKTVRKRVQAICRLRRKEKMLSEDIDFIINDIYYKYKLRAPKRGLEFNLSKDYFKTHWRKDCYYCGDTMINVGFDRIDNAKGYTEENTVPCCTQCNWMKHKMSQEEFFNRLQKIFFIHCS